MLTNVFPQTLPTVNIARVLYSLSKLQFTSLLPSFVHVLPSCTVSFPLLYLYLGDTHSLRLNSNLIFTVKVSLVTSAQTHVSLLKLVPVT